MSIWGAIAGGIASLVGNRQKAQLNSLAAKEQRSWENDMSSTAYRRSMRDMREAGLNPILAYSQGGAKTGGGAFGGISGESVAAGMQAGASTAKTSAEIENLKKINANIEADTFKKWQEGGMANQVANTSAEQAAVNRQQLKKLIAETEGIRSENVLRGQSANVYSGRQGEALRTIEAWKNALSPFINSQAMGGSSAKSKRR